MLDDVLDLIVMGARERESAVMLQGRMIAVRKDVGTVDFGPGLDPLVFRDVFNLDLMAREKAKAPCREHIEGPGEEQGHQRQFPPGVGAPAPAKTRRAARASGRNGSFGEVS